MWDHENSIWFHCRIKQSWTKKPPHYPLVHTRSMENHEVNIPNSRTPGVMNPEQQKRNHRFFLLWRCLWRNPTSEQAKLRNSLAPDLVLWLRAISAYRRLCSFERSILFSRGPRHAQGCPLISQHRSFLPGWRVVHQQHARFELGSQTLRTRSFLLEVAQTLTGFFRKPDPPCKGSRASAHMLEKPLKAARPAGARQKGFHISKAHMPDPWK